MLPGCGHRRRPRQSPAIAGDRFDVKHFHNVLEAGAMPLSIFAVDCRGTCARGLPGMHLRTSIDADSLPDTPVPIYASQLRTAVHRQRRCSAAFGNSSADGLGISVTCGYEHSFWRSPSPHIRVFSSCKISVQTSGYVMHQPSAGQYRARKSQCRGSARIVLVIPLERSAKEVCNSCSLMMRAMR